VPPPLAVQEEGLKVSPALLLAGKLESQRWLNTSTTQVPLFQYFLKSPLLLL
jgi:hypothetical protein